MKGESDYYKVVYELSDWTKTNIDYDLNTITAKAVKKSSWVLENRQGVCDELTNLFISMLRSVGIPARFVTGMVYTNIDVGISEEFLFLNVASMLSRSCSICSGEIARFSVALVIPVFTLSLENFSLLLSFFITVRAVSILSYVVNLFLQSIHSLLLLVTILSSVSLLSNTLVLSL